AWKSPPCASKQWPGTCSSRSTRFSAAPAPGLDDRPHHQQRNDTRELRAQDQAIDVHSRPPLDVALAASVDADRACSHAPAAPPGGSVLALARWLALTGATAEAATYAGDRDDQDAVVLDRLSVHPECRPRVEGIIRTALGENGA